MDITSGRNKIYNAKDSNTFITRYYDITEIPMFVRLGAMIGKLTDNHHGNLIGRAAREYSELNLVVYGGGSRVIYQVVIHVYLTSHVTTA